MSVPDVGAIPAVWGLALQESLHCSERFIVDDGFVFTIVDAVLVPGLANVNDIGKQVIELATREGQLALPGWSRITVSTALVIQFVDQDGGRLQFKVAAEDSADLVGSFRVDHQLLVDGPVAERHRTSHPDPLLARG